MVKQSILLFNLFLFLFLSGCSKQDFECTVYQTADLTLSQEFSEDDKYPFRFPFETTDEKTIQDAATFQTKSMYRRSKGSPLITRFHCAEDYYSPAGTPVYAIADGAVGYSGQIKGYGWLVIINHGEINLYSLYGHLSPSRWKINEGIAVKKGDLIGYLGDDFENGGTKKRPLITHIHLGVRAGQMEDYPQKGEWRWMAGWINLCPDKLGWFQPSKIINSQNISREEYPDPEVNFFRFWFMEIVISLVYTLCALFFLLKSFREKTVIPLFILGTLMIMAGIIFKMRHIDIFWVTLSLTVILFFSGFLLMKRRKN